jgi:hypothetical protein
MKRCQKCNRTYTDDNQKFCTNDGGLLVNADQAFDPNATIQSSASNMGYPPAAPTPGATVDLNATIASSPDAETAVLPRNTGPTGSPTFAHQGSAPLPPQQSPSAPLPPPPPTPQYQSAPLPPAPAAPEKKKSKLPLILGITALLLVLGAGALIAVFFLVIKPRLDERQEGTVITRTDRPVDDANRNANSNTAPVENAPPTAPEFTPPAGAIQFVNAQSNLDGKLAEHYLDFSFYYPQTWATDPKAGVPGASNFAKVERKLPGDLTQENFAVGWYTSKGTVAADSPTFPQLVEFLGGSLAKGFPGYRKVSEGPTKINKLDGYEFRFVSLTPVPDKGQVQLWGRVVFLPTGVSGDQTGATLIMLATSLAPELSGVEDVGEKGEMPVILESFRFGRK